MATAASDARLVRQAVAGREDAYRELTLRYQRPIYGLILRMVRDPAAAEDLAQETFVKAFRALAGYDPRRRFSSWLFKIAHNATIDHLRRSRPGEVPLETGDEGTADPIDRLAAPAAETPHARAERGEMARAIESAILALRPAYREVVLLRFREGLAYEEIGEITGLPLGTVKTHLHRARKAMARELRSAGWAPGGGGSGDRPRGSPKGHLKGRAKSDPKARRRGRSGAE